ERDGIRTGTGESADTVHDTDECDGGGGAGRGSTDESGIHADGECGERESDDDRVLVVAECGEPACPRPRRAIASDRPACNIKPGPRKPCGPALYPLSIDRYNDIVQSPALVLGAFPLIHVAGKLQCQRLARMREREPQLVNTVTEEPVP